MMFKSQQEVWNYLLKGNKVQNTFSNDIFYFQDGKLMKENMVGSTKVVTASMADFQNTFQTTIEYVTPIVKVKVKLYKYAYIYTYLKDQAMWKDSVYYYRNDEDFLKINENWKHFKKLEYSMIEVEENE